MLTRMFFRSKTLCPGGMIFPGAVMMSGVVANAGMGLFAKITTYTPYTACCSGGMLVLGIL